MLCLNMISTKHAVCSSEARKVVRLYLQMNSAHFFCSAEIARNITYMTHKYFWLLGVVFLSNRSSSEPLGLNLKVEIMNTPMDFSEFRPLFLVEIRPECAVHTFYCSDESIGEIGERIRIYQGSNHDHRGKHGSRAQFWSVTKLCSVCVEIRDDLSKIKS